MPSRIPSRGYDSPMMRWYTEISPAFGVVVGLKFKRIGDRVAEKQVLNSCFVVNPLTDKRCSNVPMNVQVENINELVMV